MSRTHDPAREHRILYEIIADCYDEVKEYMGWYYYMAENLVFPIDVTVRFRLRGGATEMKPARIMEIDPKSEQSRRSGWA
ncbi:MAG: calcium-binding protein [Saprospiraceae bacterium]